MSENENPNENKIIPGDDIPWTLLRQTVNIHAKAGLIPRNTTFEQAMICAALGHQLGIPRFEAMRGIVVVDGKPTLMAGLLQAVVTRSLPQLEVQLVAYERDHCTVRGRRHPNHDWTQITFDWEDAKIAGLTGKQNWKSYPKAMLYARASTILLRMLGADVIHGVYTPDELGAEEDPEEGRIMGTATADTLRTPDLPGQTNFTDDGEEPIDAPFEPRSEAERNLESGVDALAARIGGGPSESPSPAASETSESPEPSPSKDESSSSPPSKPPSGSALSEKKDWPGRRRKLARTLVDGKYAKTQKECKPHLDEAVDAHPEDAEDSVLLQYVIENYYTTEADPEPSADADDDLDSLTAEELMDICTDLEDKFTDGREGDEQTKALDARTQAQKASPEWMDTEDPELLKVYARNLRAELQKLDA